MESELPIAHLVGVTEHDSEPANCSLVFTLETKDGVQFELPYGVLMEAMRFAQEQKIIPALSSEWWGRIGETYGCFF